MLLQYTFIRNHHSHLCTCMVSVGWCEPSNVSRVQPSMNVQAATHHNIIFHGFHRTTFSCSINTQLGNICCNWPISFQAFSSIFTSFLLPVHICAFILHHIVGNRSVCCNKILIFDNFYWLGKGIVLHCYFFDNEINPLSLKKQG